MRRRRSSSNPWTGAARSSRPAIASKSKLAASGVPIAARSRSGRRPSGEAAKSAFRMSSSPAARPSIAARRRASPAFCRSLHSCLSRRAASAPSQPTSSPSRGRAGRRRSRLSLSSGSSASWRAEAISQTSARLSTAPSMASRRSPRSSRPAWPRRRSAASPSPVSASAASNSLDRLRAATPGVRTRGKSWRNAARSRYGANSAGSISRPSIGSSAPAERRPVRWKASWSWNATCIFVTFAGSLCPRGFRRLPPRWRWRRLAARW